MGSLAGGARAPFKGRRTRSAAEDAVRGDPDAIRTVWQEHRGWIATVLLSHKPREVELDDLLQDVALSMVRNITHVRDESSIAGWLRQIAVNAARAAGRKQTVRRRVAGGGVDEHTLPRQDQPTPPPAPEREEARRLLDLAEELPEAYREPLLLRCARGMSYRRISAITGLPETTVETRIARGRRMLREMAKARAIDDAGQASPKARTPALPRARRRINGSNGGSSAGSSGMNGGSTP
ncbi:MAG: sigma-70 family RNA polymerase sigma factor [Planctomycetota bacterium]